MLRAYGVASHKNIMNLSREQCLCFPTCNLGKLRHMKATAERRQSSFTQWRWCMSGTHTPSKWWNCNHEVQSVPLCVRFEVLKCDNDYVDLHDEQQLCWDQLYVRKMSIWDDQQWRMLNDCAECRTSRFWPTEWLEYKSWHIYSTWHLPEDTLLQ